MAKSIQTLIDKALIRPPRIRSGKWSPSSFGGCYRKQYWNRKDEPKSNPIDNRTLRVFEAGHLFEKFVVDLIAKDNQCDLQVEVGEDDVKGFADIVRDNEVVDVKSQHSRSFWWMKKTKDIKKDKYHNWLQVGYYAKILGKEFMRLVFVSKDDLCIAEYVEPMDIYWINEIERELKALRDIWEKDELPPAEPRLFPKKDGTFSECRYCAWQDKCKAIEEEKENG